MTLVDASHPAACPACVAGDAMDLVSETSEARPQDIRLSLPTIHCAACISGVERALSATPGVNEARVNLTMKRARIDAVPGVTADSLIEVLARAGYEAHELDPTALSATEADKQSRDLLMRLGVAGFAMMNVMLMSVAVWSGATEATRDLFHWISATIAVPTVAFSAQPFFKSAWSALRVGRLNMDVPISLAILLATGMSIYETAQGGSHAYFDAALSLTFFLLAGRYLDYRTRHTARSAAEELAALEVPRVTVLRDGVELEVPLADVGVGELLLIRPGARMPADARVVTGHSELDFSLLNGETHPVAVAPGAEVSAGVINLTGPLEVEIVRAAEDSALRRMADLVAVAEEAKSRYTSLADRAARIYAPVVHLLALATFIGWFSASGDWRLAMNIAVATLIITCPCALGLAVPAVSTAASGRLFRKGMLIKHATALERLAEVECVVFDKTGTLTLGTPKPDDLSHVDATDLAIVRTLAAASSHPLSTALAEAISAPGAVLSDLREVPGFGVEGCWDGRLVRLGRAEWIGAEPAKKTATYLKVGDAAPLTFTFTDSLRPGAKEAVAGFKAAGFDVMLLSGDTEAAVQNVAAQLDIPVARSGLLPQEKAAEIAALSQRGTKTLMIGDGLNDTAALAEAHVSMSPASALDASRVVSDIVVLSTSFESLPDAVRTATRARRRILENFGIAATYNAIAIPIALAGFATPLAAALAMSTSSILVSLNALRVR
ncbi:MAG: cadmium-translocating P-type ATPase [Rhodobacteraceae bacterium]|nr:cadmium-translocating P-type ATPase [Paracoccaceae bacterium]